MKRKAAVALCIAFFLPLACREASAVIVNIDATVSGCTACPGGPLNPDVQLGTVVTLISPEKLTLGLGTYTITNAATVNGVEPGATSGFLGWNFEAGNSSAWVWNFLVATDKGNGTGTMLKADFVSGTFFQPDGRRLRHGCTNGELPDRASGDFDCGLHRHFDTQPDDDPGFLRR